MATTDRGGKVPESLMRSHKRLLAIQWQRLSDAELIEHLKRIVVAEHQRHAKTIEGVRYFADPRLQPELRQRRLLIARHLVKNGQVISPILLEHALPHENWPGLVGLFPTPGFELSRGHA